MTYLRCSLAGFLLAVVFLPHCTRGRDQALRQLYVDGLQYLKSTRARLEGVRNVDEAVRVAEEVLPELEKLIQRKKQLEEKYPEIANLETREKIHTQFPEFLEFREEFRHLYKLGGTLWQKYRTNRRYATAVQRAFTLLAYF